MTVKLGPADHATQDQLARRSSSRCPTRTVTTNHNTPHSGTAEWWSGFGDDLNSTLTRTVDLTGARRPASVSACVQGNLEVRTTTTSTARCRPTVAPRWTAGRRADRRRLRAGPRRPGTCRPTRARTSSSASASRPTVACSSEAFLDDIAVTVDGVDRTDGRRRGRRRCLDRQGGFTHHQRHHLASRCRTSTSPRTASTAATTRR